MRRISAALLILMATAANAAAQRGGTTAPTGDTPRPARLQRPPTVGQLEDLNPARMLVDKRKKLSLVDSQVAQMKAVERVIEGRNAPLLAEYDSVRKEIRFQNNAAAAGAMGSTMGSAAPRGRNTRSGSSGGVSTPQTPEEAAKFRSQMQALTAIALKLQERRPADVAESLALLTSDQVAKAQEFLVEQAEEMDRILPRGGRGG